MPAFNFTAKAYKFLSPGEAAEGIYFFCMIYQNAHMFHNVHRTPQNYYTANILERRMDPGRDIVCTSFQNSVYYRLNNDTAAALRDAVWHTFVLCGETLKPRGWNPTQSYAHNNLFHDLFMWPIPEVPEHILEHDSFTVPYHSAKELQSHVHGTQIWCLVIQQIMHLYAIHEELPAQSKYCIPSFSYSASINRLADYAQFLSAINEGDHKLEWDVKASETWPLSPRPSTASSAYSLDSVLDFWYFPNPAAPFNGIIACNHGTPQPASNMPPPPPFGTLDEMNAPYYPDFNCLIKEVRPVAPVDGPTPHAEIMPAVTCEFTSVFTSCQDPDTSLGEGIKIQESDLTFEERITKRFRETFPAHPTNPEGIPLKIQDPLGHSPLSLSPSLLGSSPIHTPPEEAKEEVDVSQWADTPASIKAWNSPGTAHPSVPFHLEEVPAYARRGSSIPINSSPASSRTTHYSSYSRESIDTAMSMSPEQELFDFDNDGDLQQLLQVSQNPNLWATWQGDYWGPDPVEEKAPQELRASPASAWQQAVARRGYFAPAVYDDEDSDVFTEEYQSKGDSRSSTLEPWLDRAVRKMAGVPPVDNGTQEASWLDPDADQRDVSQWETGPDHWGLDSDCSDEGWAPELEERIWEGYRPFELEWDVPSDPWNVEKDWNGNTPGEVESRWFLLGSLHATLSSLRANPLYNFRRGTCVHVHVFRQLGWWKRRWVHEGFAGEVVYSFHDHVWCWDQRSYWRLTNTKIASMVPIDHHTMLVLWDAEQGSERHFSSSVTLVSPPPRAVLRR
ncbi:hypothetical protein BDV93DRAFT_514123 [Ceratobasidium sp. AG-I]|nr:hypothetical protein BDV93DRAFT_514123 [Ceratobasidium sp. AG-I]